MTVFRMLRLLGILVLGNLIFGGRHCHHDRHMGRCLGRSLLLGTLLGLFISRRNQKRNDDYSC